MASRTWLGSKRLGLIAILMIALIAVASYWHTGTADLNDDEFEAGVAACSHFISNYTDLHWKTHSISVKIHDRPPPNGFVRRLNELGHSTVTRPRWNVYNHRVMFVNWMKFHTETECEIGIGFGERSMWPESCQTEWYRIRLAKRDHAWIVTDFVGCGAG